MTERRTELGDAGERHGRHKRYTRLHEPAADVGREIKANRRHLLAWRDALRTAHPKGGGRHGRDRASGTVENTASDDGAPDRIGRGGTIDSRSLGADGR